METTQLEKFNIIGLAIRTTNQNGQSGIDIPKLWSRFMMENVISRVPGKVDSAIYCIYTDYEGDYTKPYTTLLGFKVDNLNNIPAGLTGKAFDAGKYTNFNAKGKFEDGVVFAMWTRIWESDLPRNYIADFEVYGENTADGEVQVDIFIGVE
ncbi:GyrI-like domain-containing protein [Mucilaginibacter gynuensis]|uniref:GyrI-like domain-containing protein n=1 Tax=Mucilaginibacter gynuensis TaxID=1302236 RepID=A0ABP8HAL7_9SPHI